MKQGWQKKKIFPLNKGIMLDDITWELRSKLYDIYTAI